MTHARRQPMRSDGSSLEAIAAYIRRHQVITDYDVAGVGPPAAASGSAAPLDLRLRLSNPSLTPIIPVQTQGCAQGSSRFVMNSGDTMGNLEQSLADKAVLSGYYVGLNI